MRKTLSALAGTLLAVGVQAVLAEPLDVLCVYYPHWHRYGKGDEWFGSNRWAQGEWCFVKDAKPRFPRGQAEGGRTAEGSHACRGILLEVRRDLRGPQAAVRLRGDGRRLRGTRHGA